MLLRTVQLLGRRALTARSVSIAATSRSTSITSFRPPFSAARFYSSDSDENEPKTYDEFTAKYVDFFQNADDMFDVQRGLNKAFSYDLVPSSDVLIAALQACRKFNDFPTAVRIFEGLKKKLDTNQDIYEEYMRDLKPIKDEFGVLTKEELQM